MNQLDTNMTHSMAPRKYYLCSKCNTKKACVVEIEKVLICIKCRYDSIGVEAFKEPLFWDL